MVEARCSCGSLVVAVTGAARMVVACHCLACQRRTGAPFGVGAFYPAAAVAVSGASKVFSRAGASGGRVHQHFCPACGSTVWWAADRLPGMLGVAVGAFADAGHPGPTRSVFERSRHGWVRFDGEVEAFPAGVGQPPR